MAPPSGSVSPPTTGTTTTSTARIISAFNPTKTYYIPAHGGLLPYGDALPIHDLTPLLKHRTPAKDPYHDRKQLKREVRAILRATSTHRRQQQRRSSPTTEQHESEISEPHLNTNSSSPPPSPPSSAPFSISSSSGASSTSPFSPIIDYPTHLSPAFHLTKSRTTYTLRPVNSSSSSSSVTWRVPWNLWSTVLLTHTPPIRVSTSPHDPRSQLFTVSNAIYRWRFASSRELVLEKAAEGIPKYVVAVFYLSVASQFFPEDMKSWVQAVGKRGAMATEGTLLVDERGVEAALAVASLLVALKRERQRWGVGGGTV